MLQNGPSVKGPFSLSVCGGGGGSGSVKIGMGSVPILAETGASPLKSIVKQI